MRCLLCLCGPGSLKRGLLRGIGGLGVEIVLPVAYRRGKGVGGIRSIMRGWLLSEAYAFKLQQS